MTLSSAAKGSYRIGEKAPVSVILTKHCRGSSSVDTPVGFGYFRPKQYRLRQIVHPLNLRGGNQGEIKPPQNKVMGGIQLINIEYQ